jgi:peptide/nickel transport system substrate-binding protein
MAMVSKFGLASAMLGMMMLGTTGAHAFNESPMLAGLVKAGKLPPVEQRLPKTPQVFPVESVGQFGGTWHRAYKGPGDRWGPTKLMEERAVKYVMGKDGKLSLMPGFVESYSVNADATEFTFTLLDGLKWSDGHPVTTEDVRFWYEDVFSNPEIIQSTETIYAPGGVPLKVEIVDGRTFKVKFAKPYIYFLDILAKDSTGEPSLDRASFVMPAHYLKKFHPKYTSKAELDKIVAEKKVQKWQDLWRSSGLITAWNLNPDLPVLTAWKVVVPPPADVMVMERNPYYYRVDSAGNQLPYIDRIEHKLFDNQETFNLMIVQGQIDMQQRYVNTGDFTFYKQNEKKAGYKVLKWTNAETWSLIPNYVVPDDGLRALYANPKVREALSIAIDRDTANELAFAGLGKPWQAVPIEGSPYYDAELAKHWITYDAARANALLDEAGLTKKDSEGYRLRPDGKRFTIVVQYTEPEGTPTLEPIRANWKDVGVELQSRQIDRTLFDSNRDNNDFEMQFTTFDRLSIVPADTRIMLGKDGYAHKYFRWYDTAGKDGIEPPKDFALRNAWAAWDRAATAPTRAAADAETMSMLRTVVNEGYVIGIVSVPALAIVSDKVKNVRDGLVNDDTTRGEGIGYPIQYYFAK